MELKGFAALMWRWLWLIALCSVVAGAATYGINWASAPIYEASTTLLINQATASRPAPDYNTLLTSERLAKTYAELMRKRPVLEQVIANLQLPIGPDALVDRVRVSVVRDTQLLVLTLEDTNPQNAAAIANELVKVFDEQNRRSQTSRYATSMENLQREIGKLQSDIDQTETRLRELKTPLTVAQTAEQNRLQALLVQYRASYTSLVESLEQIRLSEIETSNTISVVESANVPAKPVRPRTLFNTLLALLIGALLAIGLAHLLEYLDDAVKTPDDVQNIARLSVVGAIGRTRNMPVAGNLVTIGARHVKGDPNNAIAEAYRTLRVNLTFATVDKPIRTLMVTSAAAAEGKSTTIANLAVALAQAGKRVILVDTDLRRPTLHKLFDQRNDSGFTSALLSGPDMPLRDFLLPTAVRGLRLLPSGPLPPDPATLLSSQRMAALLRTLAQEADIVLFDSPPILPVADAAVLANLCDANLLVVLAGVTRATVLKRAADQLANTGKPTLGVVLNRVTGTAGGYYTPAYYEQVQLPAPARDLAVAASYRNGQNGVHPPKGSSAD